MYICGKIGWSNKVVAQGEGIIIEYLIDEQGERRKRAPNKNGMKRNTHNQYSYLVSQIITRNKGHHILLQEKGRLY